MAHLLEGGDEEMVLRREVPVDGVLGDAEVAGDGGHRQRRVPTGLQLGDGGLEDRGLLLGAVKLGAGPRHPEILPALERGRAARRAR